MKSILLILWFALGGFAVWQRLSHHAADRRAEELTAELNDAKAGLVIAQGAYYKMPFLSNQCKATQRRYRFAGTGPHPSSSIQQHPEESQERATSGSSI